MRDLNRQRQTAIELVARHFSATWKRGSDSPDAWLIVAGKRVAVDIATIKPSGIHARDARPGLRFDKVATRVIERLQAALAETVPDGMTVAVTITAPIRLASRTAASLEETIQMFLAQRSTRPVEKKTIHGNRVHIQLLKGKIRGSPSVIGFVHNPDSDPLRLMSIAGQLLEEISRRQAGRAEPRSDRWLVVIAAGGFPYLPAYRSIYSQLRIATGFKKIVTVFDDGQLAS
jgi:hypothetical protein